MPRYMIQEELRCETCGGTGRALTPRWSEIDRQLLTIRTTYMTHPVQQPAIARNLDELADKCRETAQKDICTFAECTECGGLGVVFRNVELTRDIVAKIEESIPF